MGQSFRWFCISTCQTLGDWGKFGAWLEYNDVELLPPLLGRGLFIPENPLKDKQEPSTLALTDNEDHITIASLPPELHTQIFELVDDFVDALCFSLTSTYVWNIGFGHLCLLREKIVAPWAGGSIICLGDNLTSLPQRILDDPDLPYAGLLQDGLSKDCYYDYVEEADRPRKLTDYLYDINRRQRKIDLLTAWVSGTNMNNRDLYRMVCKCFGVEPLFYGTSHALRLLDDVDWTLRNLSRSIYIRESDLLDFPKLRTGYKLGLGHVLAAYCGWSQDYTVSYADECELHNGAWAGDRFDIVPYKEDEHWTKDSHWKNITDEVIGRLNLIYCIHAGS